MVGAIVSVVLPELLSASPNIACCCSARLLLVVLWLAPEGVLGTLARLLRRAEPRSAGQGRRSTSRRSSRPRAAGTLEVRGLTIAFGGIKAATDVASPPQPGQVTSLIGPNGAGKTTVLNMIGGFYRPDAGSIRLGERDLAGAPAWKVARAGIARTYQTTKLFGSLSVLDNVLIGLRRGRLGSMAAVRRRPTIADAAEALLAFVGYRGSLDTPAGDLPHVDRRLVEIARALAMRPRCCCSTSRLQA